jgi:hypothetical protein
MAFGEEALIVLTAQRRIGQAIQEHTLSGRRNRSGMPSLYNERPAADQNR